MALPREVSEPLTGGLGFPSPLAVPVTGRWPGGIQKPRAGLVVHIHIVPRGRVWSSFTWAWGADGEEGGVPEEVGKMTISFRDTEVRL